MGLFLLVSGILIAGTIALTTAPPRGEPITLLPPPTALPFIVDVEGAVAHPGPAYIPPNSRLQHALDAAGGALPDADLTTLNLAAPVEDGAQILVPFRLAPAPAATESANPAAFPVTPLNINTATADELTTLPDIGGVTAQRIVEYRAKFGPFATIDDLTLVFGIGIATLEKIRPYITIAP